ncbi:MAG: hypothetical protein CBD26_03195 [Candidatus Pelagibacter sp. TMED166]|nr:MAG: hypothetical protein CBD26_03195 [Candidatus Pelagibacter sp. TMED166]|tara:strand:+ start:10960 stop:11379 length:420 start_codon:yes stop_codon:yes gene_type:complete
MKKNKNLTNFPFQVNLQTRWRDLDAFGHVNNAVFATYIETARGTLFKRWSLPFDGTGHSLIIASMTINYLHQLKHPSDIIIGLKINKVGHTSFNVESYVFDKKEIDSPIATSEVVVVCFDFDNQKPVPVFDQILKDYNA